MKTMLCVLAAAFTLASAAAADVTGKWSGTFVITDPSGQTNDSTAFLVLKQTGSEITGTVGPNENEQYAIKTGRIDGDKVVLLVEAEGRVADFALVLVADRLKGDIKILHGEQKATAKLDAGRVK